MPRMPALERLLARGRARPLGESPWAALAELAGGDLKRWPVGPVSALGELKSPPPGCLRVEPLGADTGRQGAFRLPAASLELAPLEAEALAATFLETFGKDGLQLEIAVPERWYLTWDDECADARSWCGFAGPARSADDDGRPLAPAEPALRRLLSEVEMLFHTHAVNAERRDRGMPAIAGLHPWGGGMLAPSTIPGARESRGLEEPYLAGLRRLGAVRGVATARAESGNLSAGGTAWPLAIETLDIGQLAGIEQDWAAPLLVMLRRGRLNGVRIVTGRAIHETRRTDALRIWRRPRPLEELC
jgi:hypothetical protein